MTAPSNAPGAGWPAEPAAPEDTDSPEVVEASARAWEKADHDSDPYSTDPVPVPAPYLRRVWAQSEVETIEASLDLHDALAAPGPDTVPTTLPTTLPTSVQATLPAAAGDRAASAAQAASQGGDHNDADTSGGGAGTVDGGVDGEDDDVVQVKYATKYADVYEWYDQWFRHAFRRRSDARRKHWSATWDTHPEVLERMDALWRSWEKKRRDPETGASEWYLHHADPHMSFLMSPEGPFADLAHDDQGKSSSMEPLAWTPPGSEADTDPDTGPGARVRETMPRATMSILARYRAKRARRVSQG